MLWIGIMILVLMALIAGFAYLVSRICKFDYVDKASKGKKSIKILISILTVILAIAVVGIAIGAVNAIVCMIHFMLFWLIWDIFAFLLRKIRKKACKEWFLGILALCTTITYLTVGWYQAHNVWRTSYVIETDKNVGELHIVLFSDSHIGATFHAAGFKKHVEAMQKENPDVVLIAGDFVDDDTTKEDMLQCCEILGTLRTTYGIYFVFGNHDKGYYDEKYRGYSGEDLIAELEKNGVTVLQDESVLIDDRFYIVGRQDKSEEEGGGSRASMKELMKPLDKDKFIIVLDHQPRDYKAQAETQADLVLSGHTHGGQFFPINNAGVWIKENDRTYGYEKRNHTNFIVSSGISDWAVKFKTGCKSEYVVIDIR